MIEGAKLNKKNYRSSKKSGQTLIMKKIGPESGSLNRFAWRKFRKNFLAMASLSFICINILIAMAGYLITPDSSPYANDQNLEISLQKPGYRVWILRPASNKADLSVNIVSAIVYGLEDARKPILIRAWRYSGNDLLFVPADAVPGEPAQVVISPLTDWDPPVLRTYWLGTDRFGRDFLSQLMIGTRVSLSVGLISVTISLIIGITLGALAGFYRGRIDSFIVWIINVIWSIPTLLLVIAITFVLGKGFWQVFIAVGLTMWVEVARVVRGQVLSLREKEFIEASVALGFSDFRIIFRHILPNVMAAVIVISAANFASAILLEAGLSFLGLGVQPPVPSWGSMIKENYGYIILDYAYLAMIPGIAIMLLVLSFMLIGNALRDALDVRL
jgi:peptide/nickel transport system permease protein